MAFFLNTRRGVLACFNFLHFVTLCSPVKTVSRFTVNLLLFFFKTGYTSEEGPTSHDFLRKMDQGLRDQNKAPDIFYSFFMNNFMLKGDFLMLNTML